jgi:hypothetical protein
MLEFVSGPRDRNGDLSFPLTLEKVISSLVHFRRESPLEGDTLNRLGWISILIKGCFATDT